MQTKGRMLESQYFKVGGRVDECPGDLEWAVKGWSKGAKDKGGSSFQKKDFLKVSTLEK